MIVDLKKNQRWTLYRAETIAFRASTLTITLYFLTGKPALCLEPGAYPACSALSGTKLTSCSSTSAPIKKAKQEKQQKIVQAEGEAAAASML